MMFLRLITLIFKGLFYPLPCCRRSNRQYIYAGYSGFNIGTWFKNGFYAILSLFKGGILKYTVEVVRAKDKVRKSCTTETDGTEQGFQKCVNSYDLFFRSGQFSAYKITDENGFVAVKKGNI